MCFSTTSTKGAKYNWCEGAMLDLDYPLVVMGVDKRRARTGRGLADADWRTRTDGRGLADADWRTRTARVSTAYINSKRKDIQT